MRAHRNKFSKLKNSSEQKVDIEALIDKGGSFAGEEIADHASADHSCKRVQVRIPIGLLKQIDAKLSEKRITKPRHTWILEALYAKIEEEESLSKS